MARDPNKRGALSNQRRRFADEITKAAKAIVAAETAAREKKTAKLRALRLADSAANQSVESKTLKTVHSK